MNVLKKWLNLPIINDKPFYNYVCYGDFKGKLFIEDEMELYKFIADMEECKIVFVESGKHSTHTKLVIDFDYKPKDKDLYPDLDTEEFTLHTLHKLNEILQELIEDPDVRYIYCDKYPEKKGDDKGGVHIYYPEIVIDHDFAFVLYNKLVDEITIDNKYNLSVNVIRKLIDKSVFFQDGMRLLYCINNDKYYCPNIYKSTYPLINGSAKEYDKIHHLQITKIMTTLT